MTKKIELDIWNCPQRKAQVQTASLVYFTECLKKTTNGLQFLFEAKKMFWNQTVVVKNMWGYVNYISIILKVGGETKQKPASNYNNGTPGFFFLIGKVKPYLKSCM